MVLSFQITVDHWFTLLRFHTKCQWNSINSSLKEEQYWVDCWCCSCCWVCKLHTDMCCFLHENESIKYQWRWRYKMAKPSGLLCVQHRRSDIFKMLLSRKLNELANIIHLISWMHFDNGYLTWNFRASWNRPQTKHFYLCRVENCNRRLQSYK